MPIRVSIVEDDSQARAILVGWVNRAEDFCCVSDHRTGEDAVATIPTVAPQVVLMDINLPGINGIECVRRLKPLLPDTQFVMITVYEDADHVFSALAVGASGYLLKQTPRSELLAALKQAHTGGSPMTSNIARKVVQSFRQPTLPAVAGGSELSPREQEVLDLLARGYLYKEIAEALSISLPTVNTYIRRVYEKLHVRSRSQAVALYTNARWEANSIPTKASPK